MIMAFKLLNLPNLRANLFVFGSF